MSLRQSIVRQFRKPTGFPGYLAGKIMAGRSSNRSRNIWTLELMQPKPADHILEIGCGPGFALERCATYVTEGRMVGLDHSDVMLAQARQRNRVTIVDGRMRLLLGTLEEASLAEDQFDLIYSVNVVQFFRNSQEVFERILRLLKPGGRSFTTFMPRSKHANREAALDMARRVEGDMKSSGFIDLAIEELPLNPVPAVCIIGSKP